MNKKRSLPATGPTLADFIKGANVDSRSNLNPVASPTSTTHLQPSDGQKPTASTLSGDSINTNAVTSISHSSEHTKSTYIPYMPHSTTKLNKTVFLETYGCQMNVSDTEVAWSILKEAGCERTTKLDNADVALLVTCAIRENAESKIWQRLEELANMKKKRSTNFQIGVLGCMAERLKEKLLERQRLVDVIAGPDAYRDLPQLLYDSEEDKQTQINVMLSRDETYAEIAPVRLSPNSASAFVSIQRGCDNMCSYCIVPFTRGRERSRPLETIVEEAKQLQTQGVREITLLGQNVNSYNDVHSGMMEKSVMVTSQKGFKTIYKPKKLGRNFAELLAAVAEAVPNVRIRFTSPHPKDFTDEVLHTMKTFDNICKQLHLPAQSGNTNVLSRMRRGYTIETYLTLVERVKKILPDATLSSDFIAGFCGETEEEHGDTASLMKLVGYDMAYIFAYSKRDKTHASHKYEDDVEAGTKSQRVQELVEIFHEGAAKRNGERVGMETIVMVDGTSRRSSEEWVGRNEANVKVIFPKREMVDLKSGEMRRLKVGDFVKVVTDSATSLTMRGRAVALVE